MVELLLRFGADVHRVTTAGLSALWIACHQGNVACARLLLRAGAEVDACHSLDGTSALWIACHQNQLSTV